MKKAMHRTLLLVSVFGLVSCGSVRSAFNNTDRDISALVGDYHMLKAKNGDLSVLEGRVLKISEQLKEEEGVLYRQGILTRTAPEKVKEFIDIRREIYAGPSVRKIAPKQVEVDRTEKKSSQQPPKKVTTKANTPKPASKRPVASEGQKAKNTEKPFFRFNPVTGGRERLNSRGEYEPF